MKNLWWRTIGKGDCHLVLLHGWGLNSQVWNYINTLLALHFTVHLVDLPGFGRSTGFGAMALDEMAECIILYAPDMAIWLGWSLGGLVASKIALMYPMRVQALVTVASSPCFSAQGTWPGIRPKILVEFQHQLSKNFQRTVERFITLQTIGSDTAYCDTKKLKSSMLAQPIVEVTALNGGLEILKTVDLRKELIGLKLPHLRIYGALDGLVPQQIVPLLDSFWPKSKSLVMAKASHAPFISHPDEFCRLVVDFSHKIR